MWCSFFFLPKTVFNVVRMSFFSISKSPNVFRLEGEKEPGSE